MQEILRGEEVWEDLDGGLDYELDFDTASIPPSLPDVTRQIHPITHMLLAVYDFHS